MMSAFRILQLQIFERIKNTLREWMLTGFKGSRENRTPPALLRWTRKAFWLPGFNKLLVCSPAQFHIPNLRISQPTDVRVICQTRSAETLDLSAAIFMYSVDFLGVE